jgi:hypothetical protein
MLSSMLAFVFALSGCPADEETENGGSVATSEGSGGGGDEGHEEHSHADPPHGGALIEFGSDYHGEFVHDEDSVTIYILDEGVENQVAVAAEMLTINVTQDGDSTQYELTADADEGDEEGKSSRFTLTDSELVEALETEGTTARVTIVIDGTPYSGDISHDHGHSHD